MAGLPGLWYILASCSAMHEAHGFSVVLPTGMGPGGSIILDSNVVFCKFCGSMGEGKMGVEEKRQAGIMN